MPLITQSTEYEDTEQRARFLAVAHPATSLKEVKAVVAAKHKKLRKANHHVWACRFLEA